VFACSERLSFSLVRLCRMRTGQEIAAQKKTLYFAEGWLPGFW
jgi:hypothetical protein